MVQAPLPASLAKGRLVGNLTCTPPSGSTVKSRVMPSAPSSVMVVCFEVLGCCSTSSPPEKAN